MNKIVGLMLVFMLMIVAAPAYSAEVIQIIDCQIFEDSTEESIKAVTTEWRDAANKMKGGEKLEVHLRYPIVAQMGSNDFSFIITIPSLEEWGVFTGGYTGSALPAIDDKMDKLCTCPDSSLWEVEALE
jgi:hypothetical protein